MNFFNKKSGSALLTTLLIMGVLLTITIGLSKLILTDTRQTGDLLKYGQAFYAAEAGIERALLDLNSNLSGFEVEDQEFKLSDRATSKYSIANQSNTYPHFDQEITIQNSSNPAFFYNTLPLNESVTVPLFTIDKDGNTKDIKDFRVEYYVGFNEDKKLQGQLLKLHDVDILRWKIFGISKNSEKTEAISDFFPTFSTSNAANPTCLGTSKGILSTTDNPKTECPNSAPSGNTAREYYEFKDGKTIYYSSETDNIAAKLQASFGREQDDPDLQPKTGGYKIDTFLDNHSNNYLTLTNVINPEIIQADSPSTAKAIANIRYRIVTFDQDQKLVREFAEINSTGISGDITHSIEAKIQMDQFLPVFNFSLYRTSQ